MSTLEPVRYVQGRPMLLAGIRRHHAFAGMAKGIPTQWEDFLKLGPLPTQVGTTAYGAICGGDPKTEQMEYMCAVEVQSFDAVPKELGRMRVPAVRYAVFLHEGNVAHDSSHLEANLFDVAAEFRNALGEYAGLRAVRRALRRRHRRRRRRDLARGSAHRLNE